MFCNFELREREISLKLVRNGYNWLIFVLFCAYWTVRTGPHAGHCVLGLLDLSVHF
jgi:hypothetical protein